MRRIITFIMAAIAFAACDIQQDSPVEPQFIFPGGGGSIDWSYVEDQLEDADDHLWDAWADFLNAGPAFDTEGGYDDPFDENIDAHLSTVRSWINASRVSIQDAADHAANENETYTLSSLQEASYDYMIATTNQEAIAGDIIDGWAGNRGWPTAYENSLSIRLVLAEAQEDFGGSYVNMDDVWEEDLVTDHPGIAANRFEVAAGLLEASRPYMTSAANGSDPSTDNYPAELLEEFEKGTGHLSDAFESIANALDEIGGI